ncbi:MAG: type II toxin-antitoxin system VapC family toxin [Lautropia sp.]|nr:type II toxin-antitoxin system VapC family toxin [Lautropia sp.]
MIGLDTNVLVRLLIGDDDLQTQAAQRLLLSLDGTPGAVFIDDIVLVETIWVLQRSYHVEKTDLLRMLDWILSVAVFAFSDRPVLHEAVNTFREGPTGFADCLIIVRHRQAGCAHTATFDRRMARHPGARLIHANATSTQQS